jgi:hypothetical protein
MHHVIDAFCLRATGEVLAVEAGCASGCVGEFVRERDVPVECITDGVESQTDHINGIGVVYTSKAKQSRAVRLG